MGTLLNNGDGTFTLAEGKEHIRENFDKGSDCPCCGQLVKLYRRKLTSGLARSLIAIYMRDEVQAGFFHVEDYFKTVDGLHSSAGSDFQKLQYWGLIKSKRGERDDGNPANGYWRITARGREFVKGHIQLHSHYLFFNNKLQGHTGDQVSILKCLGKKFNYNELMGF